MTPTAKDILSLVNGIAPFALAETWDNSGLCAGDLRWAVNRVLVALDVTMPVMEAAMDRQADMVLTHHPLFISPEKSIDFRQMPGAAIAAAARNRICIVSAHTNLDKAQNGLNDYFARRIRLRCSGSLEQDAGPDDPGIGRIGELDTPVTVKEMILRVKSALGIDRIRMAGDSGLMVKKIAVCTGSGGSLIPAFLRSGADLYITGDIKYHEAREIELKKKCLLDVGHFASEIIAVDLLSREMEKAAARAGYEIEILGFDRERDPFTIV